MKIAYLFFAYKNPILIQRCIARLSDLQTGFFFHLDKKIPLRTFSPYLGPNVRILSNRIEVYWAEFSGVEAILLLIREALAAAENYDYLVLLSGSEYPLQSSGYIQQYFEKHHGTEFINLVRVPNVTAGKPLKRINTLWAPSTEPVLRFALRTLGVLGLSQRDHRKHLGTFSPFAGNTWWALSRSACEYIMHFYSKYSHLVDYFRYTFAPEEMFIHTIIGNSPFLLNVGHNIVFEDWGTRGAHPSLITRSHIRMFKDTPKLVLNDIYGTGEALFARKFDDASIELLDAMDVLLSERLRIIPCASRADHRPSKP